MVFDFHVAPNIICYIPPWCCTNPPNVSYIGADGQVSGGSLRIFADQIRPTCIDCVQFRLITHNMDWLCISCGATVSIADAQPWQQAAFFFLTFKKKTQPLHSSARTLTDSGGLWQMDIRFIAAMKCIAEPHMCDPSLTLGERRYKGSTDFKHCVTPNPSPRYILS